jgi:endoglucanase
MRKTINIAFLCGAACACEASTANPSGWLTADVPLPAMTNSATPDAGASAPKLDPIASSGHPSSIPPDGQDGGPGAGDAAASAPSNDAGTDVRIAPTVSPGTDAGGTRVLVVGNDGGVSRDAGGAGATGVAPAAAGPDAGGPSAANTTIDAAVLPRSLPYRGVNMSGAEWGVDYNGVGTLPGTLINDYVYPDSFAVSQEGQANLYAPAGYNNGAFTYYRGKGMTTFRLPFRWERLQRTLMGSFDATELGYLQTTVNDMLAAGAVVLIDPHNYARYGTDQIGSAAVPNAAFADFWGTLAALYKNNPNVLYGLMNEPHDLTNGAQQWFDAAQAAINAIRNAGANNLVLVPGYNWTGAADWPTASALMGSIQDPANNFAFEVHEYVDQASTTDNCGADPTIGTTQMQPFTDWARANKKRGFLGEFSGGPTLQTTASCLNAIDNQLSHIDQNSDVYIGWTYWAGGPNWGQGNPMEHGVYSTDSPQMQILVKHLR